MGKRSMAGVVGICIAFGWALGGSAQDAQRGFVEGVITEIDHEQRTVTVAIVQPPRVTRGERAVPFLMAPETRVDLYGLEPELDAGLEALSEGQFVSVEYLYDGAVTQAVRIIGHGHPQDRHPDP